MEIISFNNIIMNHNIRRPRYKLLLILILFIGSLPMAFGQVNFPEDYIGQWEGSLEIYSGNKMIMEVKMSLLIDETTQKDTFLYNLVYQGAGQEPDIRNYLLIVEDRELGKYKIDEQNTVVLPMQMFGKKLVSSFVVEGSIVHFIYNLQKDAILVEVLSGPYDQATFTGEELGVPQVGILNNQIFQTGLLKRK